MLKIFNIKDKRYKIMSINQNITTKIFLLL